MAERSEAKNAKRSFALKIKILNFFVNPCRENDHLVVQINIAKTAERNFLILILDAKLRFALSRFDFSFASIIY